MDKYERLLDFSFLHPQDMATIIWTVEGMKSVSFLFYPKCAIDSLIHILDSYSLIREYSLVPSPWDSTHIHVLSFGSQQETVHYIHELLVSHQNIPGELLGYPLTAVQGFENNLLISEDILLPLVLTSEEFTVFQATRPFRLSQQYWNEEALVTKKWIAVLKEAAPSIYARITTSPYSSGR